MQATKGQLRILSYNIHKGFRAGNRTVIVDGVKEAVHTLKPDLAFFQEVVGENTTAKSRHRNWPEISQHEYFRSDDLAHASYGRNASYPEGHHGNAILSRMPIDFETNVDCSIYKFSKRGFLYTRHSLPGYKRPLHAFCIHLGLIEKERLKQVHSLTEYIEKNIPSEDPLLLAGDFNDWREKISKRFAAKLHIKEAFVEYYGLHARSFPSWFPIYRLDRIYFRNLELKSCRRLEGRPWTRLSDHLPLVADFKLTAHQAPRREKELR